MVAPPLGLMRNLQQLLHPSNVLEVYRGFFVINIMTAKAKELKDQLLESKKAALQVSVKCGFQYH